MPSPPEYPRQQGAPPDREAGRRQAWSDPRNPYTTARLLIARHAEAAADCAAVEMAHAQAVGDAGDYDLWAEIYDAVAVLQAPPAQASGRKGETAAATRRGGERAGELPPSPDCGHRDGSRWPGAELPQ